jgi:pyrrolidone-carboxylate peptidase
MDSAGVGMATLCLTQSLTLFQNFLPRFQEINAADPDTDAGMVQDVRMGELAAVLTTLGIGTMTSALSGSSVPAVVSAITAGGLILLYEYALANREASHAK